MVGAVSARLQNRRVRFPRITVVAALALAACLAGCTAGTSLPSGRSQAEIDALVAVELDRQWELTGLDGVAPRPVMAVERLSGINTTFAGIGDCMMDAGFSSWGFDDTGLTVAEGAPEPEQQLAYYECNARFPAVNPLSADEMHFVYDYYQKWLIPCLGFRGYTVLDPPERGVFTRGADDGWATWSPYWALEPYPATAEEYEEITAVCPPTRQGVPGWSQ